MKKRILSFVLVFLVIGVSIGVSSDALFSNVKIPRVEEIVSTSELSEEGVTRYVYGSGLVASVKNSEIKYYHSDRVQSNRLITDSSGDVDKEFKSLPFGQEIKNEGVRYSFATGKELDESELYYFGARYYDQNLGRFTSVDPVKENEPYSYVKNNPLYYVDPTGMQEEMGWFGKTVDFFLGLVSMDKESRMARHQTKLSDSKDFIMSPNVLGGTEGEKNPRRSLGSITDQMNKADKGTFRHLVDEELVQGVLEGLVEEGSVEFGWTDVGITEENARRILEGDYDEDEWYDLFYGGNEYYRSTTILVPESEEKRTSLKVIDPTSTFGKIKEFFTGVKQKRVIETRVIPAYKIEGVRQLNTVPPTEGDYQLALRRTYRAMGVERGGD